jgi:hypothetical protein
MRCPQSTICVTSRPVVWRVTGPAMPMPIGRPASMRGRFSRARKGRRPVGNAATKFEFVINLKAAKALGLTVPDKLPRGRRRGDRVNGAVGAYGKRWCGRRRGDRIVCRGANVAYWHKADIPRRLANCPLSGAKRTCAMLWLRPPWPRMILSGHRGVAFSSGDLLDAWLDQACCGVVSNVCCDVSAPRVAVLNPSAAPLLPPKPAIACTS